MYGIQFFLLFTNILQHEHMFVKGKFKIFVGFWKNIFLVRKIRSKR